MNRKPRLICLMYLMVWAVLGPVAHAQVSATLELPREVFIADEHIVATLTINNLAGREILLKGGVTEDSWCLVQLYSMRGNEHPAYRLDAPSFPEILIPAGGSVKRSIPVHELFEIPRAGQFRMRVSISFGPARAQFSTQAKFFSTVPGRKIWTSTVGVPEGRPDEGALRTFSVLSLQRDEGVFLYARLENQRDGSHFPPYPLGRMLAAMPPQMALDRNNDLYILHAANDDTYVLTQIDVATGHSGQALYRSKAPRKGRPRLEISEAGRLLIAGGARITEEETTLRANTERSRISERPQGF